MKHQTGISTLDITAQLLSVIRECLHGAVENGAFLNPGQGGLLQLLSELSAGEASKPAAGASIATHALHVSFSLDVFMDWMVGKRDIQPDWDESWARSGVDDAQWQALKDRLAVQSAALERIVGEYAPTDRESAWAATGVLAHTAFHLGAMQVKFDVLRSRGGDLKSEDIQGS